MFYDLFISYGGMIMKIKPECAICIIRQVVDAVNEITDDEGEQFRLIKSTMEVIKDVYGESAVPAWMGTIVHRYLKSISNNNDPYKNLKDKANKIALQYLDKVREMSNTNDELEKLRKKILATIAGNVIDFGAYSTEINIEKLIEDTLNGELKIQKIMSQVKIFKRYDWFIMESSFKFLLLKI